MAFTGIDEQHLTRVHLSPFLAIVELQRSHRDDERDGDRVPVLRHILAGIEAESHDAHRAAICDLLEPESMSRRARAFGCHRTYHARPWPSHHFAPMNVVHAVGVDGARSAKGVVVVIDVLRAFTVSAFALAGGARACLLVETVDEAQALAARTPRAILSAEVDTLPVPGIHISNSPAQIAGTDVRGSTLVQRTSAGTQALCAVERADTMYAASLVVATATAKACLLRRPSTVTLVASGDFPEDHACARYIAARIRGDDPEPELKQMLEPLFESERYKRLSKGDWPGFPKADLELALKADRFHFAMGATRHGEAVELNKI